MEREEIMKYHQKIFVQMFLMKKKRKAMLSKQCREEVKVGRKYLRWIDTNFVLFPPIGKVLKAKKE